MQSSQWQTKRKPGKRHVIPDAGRDDTAAAMEATKKSWLP